jgi:AcrR family transcriptional regulator
MVRTQRERSEATRGKLLDAGRRLFAADGYAATNLDEVVRAAGVTKGALYHHFDGKRDLFRAVFEREQERLAALVVEAAGRKRDPWTAFYAGCRVFFEAVLEPGVQRIALLDAPTALGWDAMREIESRFSLALIRRGLERAVEEGRMAKRPIAPLAHMLFGGLCEAAMMVARSEDQRAATREVLAELKTQLDALAVDPSPRRPGDSPARTHSRAEATRR